MKATLRYMKTWPVLLIGGLLGASCGVESNLDGLSIGSFTRATLDPTICDPSYGGTSTTCFHPPETFNIVPQSDRTMRISWLPQETFADEVRIIRNGNVVGRPPDTAGNSFWDDTGLKPDTTYLYTVCNIYVRNKAELTYCTPTFAAKTRPSPTPPPPPPPPPPQSVSCPINVTATADTYDSITLSWTNPTTGAPRISYYLERYSSGSDSAVFDLVTNTTNFHDTGLYSTNDYHYNLWAMGTATWCPVAIPPFMRPPPPAAPLPHPHAPTNLSGVLVDIPQGQYCSVHWSPTNPVLAESFEVYSREVLPTSSPNYIQFFSLPPTSTFAVVATSPNKGYAIKVCAKGWGRAACAQEVRCVYPPWPGNSIAVTAINVILDSGFEAQSGQSIVALPWQKEGTGSNGMNIGPANAHSGTNNGFIRASTGWNALTQRIDVRPNTYYRLLGWLRTSSNVTSGRLGVRRANQTVLAEVPYGPLPQYAARNLDFFSGSETSVTVFFGYTAPGADSSVQLDDISILPNAAAWDPLVTDTHIILSNDNQTAGEQAQQLRVSTRATRPKTAGKWYWEVTLNPVAGSTRSWPVIGVGIAGAPLAGRYIGEDATGWAYDPTNLEKYHDVLHQGVGAFGIGQGQVGDVIGVALDLDGGKLTFYKNGISQGVAFSGLPPGTPLYPMLGTAGMYFQATTRFLPPFSYAPPAGFAPYDSAP